MEHCSQIETITYLKTSQEFMHETVGDMKQDIKTIKDDIRLFLDTANKIYATKKEMDILRKIMFWAGTFLISTLCTCIFFLIQYITKS